MRGSDRSIAKQENTVARAKGEYLVREMMRVDPRTEDRITDILRQDKGAADLSKRLVDLFVTAYAVGSMDGASMEERFSDELAGTVRESDVEENAHEGKIAVDEWADTGYGHGV